MRSDGQIAIHREHLRELSQAGQVLHHESPSATVHNTIWWRTPRDPRASRVRLHRQLLEGSRSEPVASEGCAIVLAGPPGAGKSSIRARLTQGRPWRVVDADEFKGGLLRAAILDDTYEDQLKPAAVRQYETAGEPWFPLELGPLVHEESSYLAARARDIALAGRENVIIDTVLKSPAKAADIAERLTRAGYEDVRLVDVEASYEHSQTRVWYRWEHGYREALRSHDPHYLGGGRWVPSEFGREIYRSDGRCSSEVAALLFKRCAVCTSFELHRVIDPARPEPELEKRLQRVDGIWRDATDSGGG